MKLITETAEDVRYVIEESKGGAPKKYFIEGVFCQAEKKNGNGRVYPKHILENEIANYNRQFVREKRAFGELGHPKEPGIHLENVAILIEAIHPDGNNFIGKARVVDTPSGKIVQGLLECGAKLGVSSRGVGSLKPHNGYQLVQEDFKLITAADIVADPSAPDAFVKGIMEGKEWTFVNGRWTEVDYEYARRSIREASRHDIEQVAINLFENLIRKL